MEVPPSPTDEVWQSLERMVRGKVQEFIQEILEDEVTRFLGGREKSQRKARRSSPWRRDTASRPSRGRRRCGT